MDEILHVLIPYRDRLAHLAELVPSLRETLNRQRITCRITVIEQVDDMPFNRGALLNAGFNTINSRNSWIALHDVDMLPVDDPDYSKPAGPCHLAGRASQFSNRMPYPGYFGGVTLFPSETFVAINGFSNRFFGWGGEDDHLRHRVLVAGHRIFKRPGKFFSLPHRSNANDNLRIRNRALLSWLGQEKNRWVWAKDGLCDMSEVCPFLRKGDGFDIIPVDQHWQADFSACRHWLDLPIPEMFPVAEC